MFSLALIASNIYKHTEIFPSSVVQFLAGRKCPSESLWCRDLEAAVLSSLALLGRGPAKCLSFIQGSVQLVSFGSGIRALAVLTEDPGVVHAPDIHSYLQANTNAHKRSKSKK